MSRYIDADALMERMYHDAFETDTDMQKWDSGCWIRYKMFENAMDDAPTIDAVSVVRCKECKYWRSNTQFCAKWSYGGFISQRTLPNDFCSCGERKSDE